MPFAWQRTGQLFSPSQTNQRALHCTKNELRFVLLHLFSQKTNHPMDTRIHFASWNYFLYVSGLLLTLLYTTPVAGQITVVLQATPPSCGGFANGTVTAWPSGGVPPYAYLWNTGDTTQVISNLPAGTYSVVVTDSLGNTGNAQITLTEPPPLWAGIVHVNCALPATLTADVSGGTPPYSFNWSTGATTQTITGLDPGYYCVTIMDANLCGVVTCSTVADSVLNVAVAVTDAACNGAGGTATAIVSGGVAPYTYLWNTGDTTATIDSLPPGTYVVNVMDQAGCTASDSGSVQAAGGISAWLIVNNPVCGQNNGSITVNPIGGTPPYTYQWNNGQTGQTITNLPPGTYTVTITDSEGCTGTKTATLIDQSTLSVQATGTPESCNGALDGSATATTNGGTPPISFVWSNGQTGSSITNLAPGTYTVTATDVNGCTATDTAIVQPGPSLTVNVVSYDVSSCGGSDGWAMAQATGGTPPYSYQWSTGTTGSTIINLPAGTYSVTATDSNGCSGTATISINEPPNLLVTAIATPYVCPGQTNGQAMAFVSGGTLPYFFEWNTGATTASISNLGPGTYSVTVTDINGCSGADTVIIGNAAPDFILDVIINPPLCFGDSNGSIEVTGWGGTPPYTYEWNTGSTNNVLSYIPAGTYIVTVTESNGCSLVDTIVLPQPDPLVATINSQPPDCEVLNGSATVNVSGGTPPYMYEWNTGATTPTISNLGAGTYVVTVTDAHFCTTIAQVNLPAPNPPMVTVVGESPDCYGTSTGLASAIVTGGTPPLSYLWSTGATIPEIENLPPGTYSVTVTDAQGCTDSASIMLVQPDELIIDVILMPPLCAGDANGSIEVSGWGGTPPYSYQWNTGATTPILANIPAGTYTVTVSDAQGCSTTQVIELPEPAPLNIAVTTTPSACNSATGTATATVSGGTPPYTYLWSNGQTGPMATGLAPGNYSLTVSDAHNCQKAVLFTIVQPDPPVIDIEATDVSCPGAADGSLTANANGGTPPYSFQWSNGQNGPTIFNLPAGNYSVTVTDANGCTATAMASVNEPPQMVLELSSTPESCMGDNNGSATVTVQSGGTPPYTYLWSNGATTQTITGLAPGSYSVTVTDAHGCSASGDVFVGMGVNLVLSVTPYPVACYGDSTGSAAVTVNGGGAPYTYIWSNGATGPLADNLPAGTYSVTVTNSTGCTASASTVVTEPPLLTIELSGTDPSCADTYDGTASVLASGGTPPYSYEWSTGDSTATISGLGAGVYVVTVSDAHNCTTIDSIQLYSPPPLTVSVQSSGTCAGQANGSAYAQASGGIPPYMFAWSNGQGGNMLTGVESGTYGLTVTDASGCTTTTTVSVPEFDTPTCAITIVQPVSTPGGTDGIASVQGVGGTPPYSYLWHDGSTDSINNQLAAGPISVIITDANGCTSTCSAIMPAPAKLGDYTWLDLNMNGIQDTGEPPIAGIQVVLSGTSADGQIISGATVTDADGMYMFVVPPGTYKVTFTAPTGYQFSPPDQGSDDALDSDADPTTGMTPMVTVNMGEYNNTLDAGFYLSDTCQNVTYPGQICCDQVLCGPGLTPDPIVETLPPVGGTGPLEYMWLYHYEPGPFDPSIWTPIPGAYGPNYQPGPLDQTTYFVRCVRRVGCTTWFETNMIEIVVDSVSFAQIIAPDTVCVNTPVTLMAGNPGPGATYNWHFGFGAMPQTSTNSTEQVVWGVHGVKVVSLEVTRDGCTTQTTRHIVVSNDPVLCGGPLIVTATPLSQSVVQLEWERPGTQDDSYRYTIERAPDGQAFEVIGQLAGGQDALGAYYQFFDTSPKQGHNFYRVRLESANGPTVLSNVVEIMLTGASSIAMVYPNPAEQTVWLELLETPQAEEVSIALWSATGQKLMEQQIDPSKVRHVVPVHHLPKGIYLLELSYDRYVQKVFKLVRM